MPKLNTFFAVVCLAGMLGFGVSVHAQATDGNRLFTVIQAEGTVRIVNELNDPLKPPEDPTVLGDVEAGKQYPYGTVLKTERNSTAVLEFSEGNTVRVLANTTMAVDPTVDDAKMVRLQLGTGELDVTLDNMPEDANFEVETPVGICGAVGTEFYIMYTLHEDGYTGELIITTSSGEVTFWGPFVSFDGDTLRQGSTFAMAIIQCPQRHYVFLPMVDVMGQDISLSMAGAHKLVLEDGSTYQLAMGNVPGTPEYVAVRVVSGRILVAGEVVTEDDFAKFIRRRQPIQGVAAEEYMNEAEWLCIQCARLYMQGLDPLNISNIAMLAAPQGPTSVILYWNTWDTDWSELDDLPDMIMDVPTSPSEVEP